MQNPLKREELSPKGESSALVRWGEIQRSPLRSYSGFHRAEADTIAPQSVEELATIFAQAQSEGRHVTLRASGFSLDTQAIHDDLIVSLAALRKIKALDTEAGTITVEPGVLWGDVMQTLQPTGWMTPIMPSSPMISVGGTLSSNGVSRMSPIHGREGEHILRFRLLTPRGEVLTCSKTQHADLFHAVIGGFGYFGAVFEVTYKLQFLGARQQVETLIDKFDNYDAIFDRLRDWTQTPDGWDSVSAPLLCGPNYQRGMLFRSRYTESAPGPLYFPHRQNHIMRVPTELLMRRSWFSQRIWRMIYRFFAPKNQTFIDPIKGYTFFFDAQRKMRRFTEFFGIPSPLIQQGFVFEGEGGRHFLKEEAAPLLQQHKLWPLLTDALYLPADSFLLSPNYQRGGFAVTMAFIDLRKDRFDRTREVLELLSERCLARGGRLWLTKNAFASSACLGEMFAHVREPIRQLKTQVDPEHLIRSRFIEKIFPSLSPDKGAF
ncbi:MAG: FAD-binding oxidoreductase [Myxococcales bacterium]|nr:FAD-binding oxidoreductase [Myxococcales bacterium]